ncbi:hypothetical protein TRIUR3_04223 [Triticum urartu]|uniref:Pollen-specific protein C13 n=2 Tax=Triticum TaxID=4564 RepID=M7YJM6_TRIUA|nr:uncharacterized protein LOC119292217 [Triticum dicoccoides]XP_044330342.1 uncharacterized protein LOC123051513 [Triticum aestivum]XP_048533797.1 uncharacterized protein LOC125512745 [Triticum urartu]EMS47447.1 hypothetical protein TRIUR3_04223 [Triticum urartu]
MAWRRASMLAALVLVAAATCADAGESYGASMFTVTGTVLCQDCTKNWNAYAYNAKPIAGSVVAVTCLDEHTGRTVIHRTDTTDEEGVFKVEVPYAHDGGSCRLDPAHCLVRLVRSGDKGCAVLTNFNGGTTGEKPYRPSRVSPTEVAYSAGPYYATFTQCDVDGDDKSCS